MNPILEDLMRKRGLTLESLSPSERVDYERWESILENEVTVKTIKDFCENQKLKIEAKWANLDNKTIKNERLIIMHTVYSALLKAFRSNKKIRKETEAYLLTLLKE